MISLVNDLKWEINDDYLVIKGYDGLQSSLVIPSEIDGIPVKAIDEEAFA